MQIRLSIAIALSWALATLCSPSHNSRAAAMQLQEPSGILEARAKRPINPLPNEYGSNPSGSNPSGAHPEGTKPCGTYLPEATDGPCGAWWLAAHPGYHPKMTMTTTTVATVTATVTK